MPGTKILIVDDDEDLLKIVGIKLVQKGYVVLLAHNGSEALDKARSGAPQAIVMDLVLPDMNGAEVVRVLREDPRTKHIPVIFLTGMITRQEEEALLDITVDDKTFPTIAKPFEDPDLFKAIEKAVGRIQP